MKAKAKPKPKAKAKPKAKPKVKAKPKAKPKAGPAPVAASAMTPPGATGFADFTWGMPRADVAKRYKLSRKNQVATTIAGVRVWVSFRFDGKNHLDHISVGSQERYAEWGDGDGDYA